MESRVNKVADQEATALKCIACEKSQYEVSTLIVVQDEAAICDKCVLLCLEILNEKVAGRQEAKENDTPKRVEEQAKFSWWKRILGIHQEVPSEAPRSVRESPTTPSPLESDPEDYQKLLDHCEELLVQLEGLFRTRGSHPVAYDIKLDLPERWKETYETLTSKMAWCDRNMDAIEERNAEVAGSGLVARRRNLAARRSEVDS